MYVYIYKSANALVPPTPIWRAMVIRCYPMLSYMFPYLSCLSMIFTRILGDLKVETDTCVPGSWNGPIETACGA